MAQRKKTSTISATTVGSIIGIAIALSAVGIAGAMSVSYGHNRDGDMMDGGMSNMMSGMMDNDEGTTDDTGMAAHCGAMAAGGMMNGAGMPCMAMMHGDMNDDDIDAMLQAMDKDGDGMCDLCGMSVEMCRQMMAQ